jgi:integrase/recombinase XerD
MAKSSEARRNRRVCMGAGDLAPLVKEFTHHLSNLGHTSLTVRGYDCSLRHFVQWLRLNKLAVADIAAAPRAGTPS